MQEEGFHSRVMVGVFVQNDCRDNSSGQLKIFRLKVKVKVNVTEERFRLLR
jgi:hypothetical protein